MVDLSYCLACKRTRVDEIDGQSICSHDGEIIRDCVNNSRFIESESMKEFLNRKDGVRMGRAHETVAEKLLRLQASLAQEKDKLAKLQGLLQEVCSGERLKLVPDSHTETDCTMYLYGDTAEAVIMYLKGSQHRLVESIEYQIEKTKNPDALAGFRQFIDEDEVTLEAAQD